MFRVGIVGIGFMGMIHYLAYQRVPGARAVALCSRDEKKRRGDWRGIQGNFGPAGQQMDLSAVRTYAQLDELLADAEVDMVDICLPPAQHASATIQAVSAGKHVLCEKPMALTDDECRQMVEASQRAGRQVLIAHVLPWFPEFAQAWTLVQQGRYGQPLGGYFKRVISDPQWLTDYYDPRQVGGPLIDLHVHDAHFIRILFGMPSAVTSQGRMRGEVVEYCHSLFHFQDRPLSVAATSGVIRQQGRAFTHGFEIHLEKATLQFEMAVIDRQPRVLIPFTIYAEDGVQQPQLVSGDEVDAFAGELTEVKQAIESGRTSRLLDSALARDAIALCHRQTDSVRQGRTVSV
jgi:predicted dehydrogenase